MADLFSMRKTGKDNGSSGYDAADIEVLEGLEPVRRRPGMYIGGTDDRALHHLVSEILDNAMDEAVAGHADCITLTLGADQSVTVTDNGRGIPVDNHPKHPGKSALEVIFTTLHSGGKFSGKVYQTSGGLHGVGSAVVNALSDKLWVEVARDGQLYRQTYARGHVTSKLEKKGKTKDRGTTVCFHPDPEIFGAKMEFKPEWMYRMARSKAYLFRGVEIHWSCAPELLDDVHKIPATDKFKFPRGLLDFLETSLGDRATLTPKAFYGTAKLPGGAGQAEFAVAWPEDGDDGFIHSYCNTIPTPQGGTHEQGLRNALSRGLKNYGEMAGNKKAANITADDVLGGAAILLSVFITDPQFQGQTKEKLATTEATRLVDTAVKDHFDHWLTADPQSAGKLLDTIIARAEERQRQKDDKTARKSATRKLRLPGKLSDCSRTESTGTELFIVEGDSAGGSAKQARNRETQAVLPLRGKILNVVSATADKMRANQEIQDLILAMGCGAGKDFKLDNLRYEKIIIMTDADVDGAHIASLLVTFFYTQMRPLVDKGHLYLAQPPLYRLTDGKQSVYAHDDAHKDELMKSVFKNKTKVDISRFKGLGEMPAIQLKETTMSPASRTLIRVTLPVLLDMAGIPGAPGEVDDLVERLMGRNADARFQFIQQHAEFVKDIDI